MARSFFWVLGLSLACAGGAWAQGQRAGTLPPAGPPAPAEYGTPADHGQGTAASLPFLDGACFNCQASPPPQYYARVDYLMWWIRGGSVPPLVTTGPETAPSAGTIGDPETRVLFGGELDYGTFSGLRFAAGISPGDGAWGFEIGGFLLQQGDIHFGAASNATNGAPLITRPFFDNVNNIESAYDVASEGRFSGRIDIDAESQLWGYEANVMFHPAWETCGPRHDLFLGFRSLGLDESLNIHARLNPLQPGILVFKNQGVNPPNGQGTIDLFDTENRFYGPQIGSRFNWESGPLGLTLAAKVAIGVNHQTVEVSGLSELTTNGVVTDRTTGGVLAQRTNIGRYSRDEFALVPEIGLQAHYDVLSWLRASIGYNLLYITSVARPGDQIDRNVDIRQVPIDPAFDAGAAAAVRRPRFDFRDSDFWAHGLNFGLEVRY